MDPAEHVIKRLMTAVKCTVCGANYESHGVHVLGHQEELWFLSVTCGRCGSQSVVAALMKDPGRGKTGKIPTPQLWDNRPPGEDPEPEAEEPTPAKVMPEDVLDMHRFLAEFDGDFVRLFGRPR